MWANITLDILYAKNYNMGFPTTRTDSLLRITHWQYWWWFWFTYFLVLYYFLVLRLFRFRLLKFRPKLATTTRSHGKWGDLIVCLLPISWCANILTNSNLILRMLEWQSESSLFTVRVRGKQWYWVYKFELKAITDILSAPKNIGHNKWFISMFNDIKVADDYLHIIQLRSQNSWVKSYWSEIFERYVKEPDFYISSPQELLYIDYLNIKKDAEKTQFLAKNLNSNFSNFIKKYNIKDTILADIYNISNFDLNDLFINTKNNKNRNLSSCFKSTDLTNLGLKFFFKNYSTSQNFWTSFDSKINKITDLNFLDTNAVKIPFRNFYFFSKNTFDLETFLNSYKNKPFGDLILDPMFNENIINISVDVPNPIFNEINNKLNQEYINFFNDMVKFNVNSTYVSNILDKHQSDNPQLTSVLETELNYNFFKKTKNFDIHHSIFKNVLLKNFYTISSTFRNFYTNEYPSNWHTKFLTTKFSYLHPEFRYKHFLNSGALGNFNTTSKLNYNTILFRHLDHPLSQFNFPFKKNLNNNIISKENLNLLDTPNIFLFKHPSNFFYKEDMGSSNLEPELNLMFKKFFTEFSHDNFFNSDIPDIQRWIKPVDDVKLPIRLIKNPLKYQNFNDLEVNLDDNFKLFRLKFNEDSGLMQNKPLPLSSYLIYKQKRYTRRDKFVGIEKPKLKPISNTFFLKKINTSTPNLKSYNIPAQNSNIGYQPIADFFKSITKYVKSKKDFKMLLDLKSFDPFKLSSKKLELLELIALEKKKQKEKEERANLLKIGVQKGTESVDNKVGEKISIKKSENINPYLVGNQMIVDNMEEVTKNYMSVKHTKNVSENTQNTFGRRLLRTKRTLVLPAHVNITIITNSYDVIHSWFIPGLGLKLDCIPGRATHHMLHIDNVGFYYGQCAEICGRYHHHMPIRICALPFEHFLVWWHTFGLPKMLFLHNKKKVSPLYTSKKYTW